MTDCTAAFVAPVITEFRAYDGTLVQHIPFPRGVWFNSESLAMMLGITRNHLYVLARIHRAKLGRPHYRVRWNNPIHPRLERIYSEADYDFFRSCFTVVVGKLTRKNLKPPSHTNKRRRLAAQLAAQMACNIATVIPPDPAV